MHTVDDILNATSDALDLLRDPLDTAGDFEPATICGLAINLSDDPGVGRLVLSNGQRFRITVTVDTTPAEV